MIIKADQSNLQEILQKYSDIIVLMYFYDPEQSNTKPLTDELEKSVGADNKFILLAETSAADALIQQVCMQLNIRSLPAICVFSEGSPIDIIQAQRLQNLPAIAGLIASYMPPKEQILIKEAKELEAAGKLNEAYTKVKEAYELKPKDTTILFSFISISTRIKKLKEARAAINQVSDADQQTQIYKDLLSQLTLAEANQKSPETQILEDKIKQNPDDIESVAALATSWSQNGKTEEALSMLLVYLKKDLNTGNLKKIYLDIIATMAGDPLQAKYRRSLYSLMY